MGTRSTQELHNRWDMLKQFRGNHEDTWQEIFDLGQPYRGDVNTLRSEGDRRIEGVFDSTMMLASEGFTNFLQGTVVPNGTDWLRLLPPTDFLANLEIRQHADNIAFKALRALSNSNFYIQTGVALRDLSLIGNQCMLTEEDRPRLNQDGSTFGGMIYKAVPIRRVWWQTGKNDRVMFIVREFEIPAVDAYSFFEGQPGTEAVMRLSEQQGSYEMVRYLQFSYMNEDGIPGGLSAPDDSPWISHWVTAGDDGPIESIRIKGEQQSAYTVGRWMIVDGEEYGRGKGHVARVDGLGISELRRQVLIAAGREINPPLMLEDENQIEPDTTPSGIMLVRPPVKLAPQFLTSGSNFAVANQIGVEDRRQIQQAFLTQAFEQPETEPRSAEETRARRNRVLQQLAAPANIIEHELLSPIVERTISIMHRSGALPELDELARLMPGEDLLIEFTSPFFTAQKEATVERTRAYVERQAALAQLVGDPSVLDRIDMDAASSLDARLSDVPAEIFRDDEEVDAIRQARADAQQAAEQREAALQLSQAGANVAQAQAEAPVVP